MNRFDVWYMNLVEQKLKAIINKTLSVTDASKELSVTRQTIYTWQMRYERYGIDGLIKERKKRTDTPHNKTSEAVEQLVINTASTYWQDGVEALADHIQRLYNLTINPTTVYRILKREGIRYSERQPRTTKRWKIKLYSHQIPGLELQMDTTYPFGYKQGRVIYTIIDDATRWVYAWTYTTANAVNTIDFLERVQAHIPFSMQKIRTDQGSEFRAQLVREYLAGIHIKHRLNTPYCPEENGKIERFHRTLGQKCVVGMSASDSLDTLQYKLTLFLHYYNYQKRHRGLGMEGMTPMQKIGSCL